MTAFWDFLLAEFRALGGTAENLRPGEGAHGRGLFPIDHNKPIRLHVPESLLLDVRFVDVSDGELKIAAGAPLGPRERAFLELYERQFSWGVNRRPLGEALQMVAAAPPEVRQMLKTPFQTDEWLAGANPQAVAERFLASHSLRYRLGRVIAPVADLINHGIGPPFRTNRGIALQGRFAGEVVTRYGPTDPLGIFGQWGFASPDEKFALSLGLGLKTKSGALVIGRATPSFGGSGNPFVPEVSAQGDTIRFSHLLLGHKRYPKLPRGIFYRVMKQAGRADGESIFDQIQHINRTGFYQLAAAAEKAAPPLRGMLRDVARHQLEAMSYNFGASELTPG